MGYLGTAYYASVDYEYVRKALLPGGLSEVGRVLGLGSKPNYADLLKKCEYDEAVVETSLVELNAAHLPAAQHSDLVSLIQAFRLVYGAGLRLRILVQHYGKLRDHQAAYASRCLTEYRQQCAQAANFEPVLRRLAAALPRYEAEIAEALASVPDDCFQRHIAKEPWELAAM
jgi:hypothetical protein